MMLKVRYTVKTASLIKVVIAPGIHLFPSRTEKLSPVTPMVLCKWESRQPPLKRSLDNTSCRGFVILGELREGETREKIGEMR